MSEETKEPKKRGRKKKAEAETAVEVAVSESAEVSVDTNSEAEESVVTEPVEAAEVTVEEVKPVEVEAAKEEVKAEKKEVTKAPSPKSSSKISYVGKRITANPIIKIYRGPSDSVPGRAYGGQIEILDEPFNGFTKVRYVKAGVGPAIGFAKLSDTDLSRAR